MSQPFRKGHEASSKTTKRRIQRKQRQQQKVYLNGKGRRKQRKPKGKKEKAPVLSKAYPCGPKQMALGEPIVEHKEKR